MANVHPKEIELYLASDGSSPFEEWLIGLKDAKARARVNARFDRLRLGNFGDCKSVGSVVFELRIDYGPGYRIYFGQDGETLVILLCGGDKSSQAADIKNANKFWADYKAKRGKDDTDENN